MKAYPELALSLGAIEENARHLKEHGDAASIEMVGVLKCLRSAPEVAQACMRGGLRYLADSRVENLVRLREALPGEECRFMLIRSPMSCQTDEAVRVCDTILVSERGVLVRLSDAARRAGRTIDVLPIVDLGDRREGMPPGQLVAFSRYASMLPGLRVTGVAANLGCLARVQATPRNHALLLRSAQAVRDQLSLVCETVSTGGTLTLTLLEHGTMPTGVTQIRVGEALLLGTSTAERRVIPWLRQDTALLRAEIIELQEKQAEPEGLIRVDAMHPELTLRVSSKGMRRRAILALGTLDTDVASLSPVLDGAAVLGGTSDHLVVDVTESSAELAAGDAMEFTLSYAALARAAASPYLHITYV